MSSYFRRQLADYVEYHRDPWNCAMHVFGIVFLFLAAVLPLSLWSITVFGIQTSAATIAVVPVLISCSVGRRGQIVSNKSCASASPVRDMTLLKLGNRH